MALLLSLRPWGSREENTTFPLIGEGRRRAGGQVAGVRGRAGWAGGGVPTLQGERGETSSILHACNIQPELEPVRSPALGAERSPLGWGALAGVGAGSLGGCRAQACPLSYRSPLGEPSLDIAGPASS